MWDRTHIPCIGRKIPSYWTAREIPVLYSLGNQGQLPLTDVDPLLSCWFLDTGSQIHKWQFSLRVQRPLWWAKGCKPAKPRIMGVGTAESLCGSWEMMMISGATCASTPSFPSHKQKPDSVKCTYCISQDVTPSLQTMFPSWHVSCNFSGSFQCAIRSAISGWCERWFNQ